MTDSSGSPYRAHRPDQPLDEDWLRGRGHTGGADRLAPDAGTSDPGFASPGQRSAYTFSGAPTSKPTPAIPSEAEFAARRSANQPTSRAESRRIEERLRAARDQVRDSWTQLGMTPPVAAGNGAGAPGQRPEPAADSTAPPAFDQAKPPAERTGLVSSQTPAVVPRRSSAQPVSPEPAGSELPAHQRPAAVGRRFNATGEAEAPLLSRSAESAPPDPPSPSTPEPAESFEPPPVPPAAQAEAVAAASSNWPEPGLAPRRGEPEPPRRAEGDAWHGPVSQVDPFAPGTSGGFEVVPDQKAPLTLGEPDRASTLGQSVAVPPPPAKTSKPSRPPLAAPAPAPMPTVTAKPLAAQPTPPGPSLPGASQVEPPAALDSSEWPRPTWAAPMGREMVEDPVLSGPDAYVEPMMALDPDLAQPSQPVEPYRAAPAATTAASGRSPAIGFGPDGRVAPSSVGSALAGPRQSPTSPPPARTAPASPAASASPAPAEDLLSDPVAAAKARIQALAEQIRAETLSSAPNRTRPRPVTSPRPSPRPGPAAHGGLGRPVVAQPTPHPPAVPPAVFGEAAPPPSLPAVDPVAKSLPAEVPPGPSDWEAELEVQAQAPASEVEDEADLELNWGVPSTELPVVVASIASGPDDGLVPDDVAEELEAGEAEAQVDGDDDDMGWEGPPEIDDDGRGPWLDGPDAPRGRVSSRVGGRVAVAVGSGLLIGAIVAVLKLFVL